MKYDYCNLSSALYEKLVVCVCQQILGTTATGYSLGRDGGRDVSFSGTAKEIPNWSGKFIAQAKHTTNPIAKFSDTDFYSEDSKSNVLAKENSKIKQLFDNKELDYYILFSNRTLPGTVDMQIKRYIHCNTGIPVDNILLVGNESMEIWLQRFPEIADWADIDPIDFPLTVDAAELAEVILQLAQWKDDVINETESQIPERTRFDEKIMINNMTPAYADLIRKYVSNYEDIKRFLESDEESRQRYEIVTEELNAKIIAKRRGYQSFDEVIEYLYDLYVQRDSDLKRNKKILRQLLYFMFWYCDIGKNTDDSTDETFPS